ncbi:MAG TPA: ABC transporter substrate-binding protein [Acetobacteraceae bacterium]|jgi:peptide/nickel transport system substrate-binding protein|nr:ABC transporter substrate-binding protein [Acetobacteraceae bacterium]
MRLRLRTILCGLALLAAHPVAAQTLHVALREDADILDPTLARSYVGRIVFAGLCDKLFDLDDKLQIVPQLALGYEWTDPKTLILHLRPNVTFHDGEPFDAEAVKYGLERHLTMQGSFRRAEIGIIDHIEVVDPLTVRLVLKSPSSPLLSLLTDRSGMIVAPKAAEAAGKDFGLHPVCTGPFKFTERVAQDRIVLDRYPGYWDAANIHFDRVIYQPMPDSTVLVANLKTGTIDLAERVLPTDVAEVKKDPRLRIVTSPALGYNGVTFNLANGDRAKAPIGQNALLRQAFDAAIDRQALIEVVFNGMYQPTVQAVPASSPFYVPAFPPPPRDIDKAKALVKQSGIATPIPVTMNVPNSSDNAQLAEVIQSMVRDAGFDLKINLIEFASSLSAAARGDFESYLIFWSGRPDADGNLYSFLHSGAGQNDGRYANPVVDAALDTARTLTDPAARRAEYAKMMEQERKDLPIVYLYNPVNVVGLSAKLSGFHPVPDGIIRLQGLSIAK